MAQLKSTTVSGLVSANNIELYGTSQVPTAYIDFHYNNSTDDYTSRIMESSSGTINIDNKLTVGGTAVSLEGHAHSIIAYMEYGNETNTSNCMQMYVALKLFGPSVLIHFSTGSSDMYFKSFSFTENCGIYIIRTYIIYTPTSDVSAGTAITLAYLDGNVTGSLNTLGTSKGFTTINEVLEFGKERLLPPNNIAVNCFLGNTISKKCTACLTSEGKIIIRHSGKLTAGTTYNFYISGMFLR